MIHGVNVGPKQAIFESLAEIARETVFRDAEPPSANKAIASQLGISEDTEDIVQLSEKLGSIGTLLRWRQLPFLLSVKRGR